MKLLLTRYKLLGVNRVGFLTLTINPKLFGAGIDGLDYVSRSRAVSESLRYLGTLLGNRRGGLAYHAVKQFHRVSGNLHVHILIDGLGVIPKGVLRKFNRWCLQRLGNCDYKYKKAEDAVAYAARYISRPGEIPDWVKALPSGQFRWTSSSHGYWPSEMRAERKAFESIDWRSYPMSIDEHSGRVLYGDAPEDLHELLDADEAAKRSRSGASRTMAERESQCGGSCVVLRPEGDGRYRFVANLKVAYWELGNVEWLSEEYWEQLSQENDDGRILNSFWVPEQRAYWLEKAFDRLRAYERGEYMASGEWEAFHGVGEYVDGPPAGPAERGPAGVDLSLDSYGRSVEASKVASDVSPWLDSAWSGKGVF